MQEDEEDIATRVTDARCFFLASFSSLPITDRERGKTKTRPRIDGA